MSIVYQENAFKERVTFAANHISSGRESNRTFCTCFEMNDGDAVIVALLRRIEKRPNTKLALNVWRYLARVSAEPLLDRHKAVTCLSSFAATLRSQ